MQYSLNDAVWESNALVPAELNQRLLCEVKRMRDVPEEEKDWHPGSDNQVLDLVHPSMYCMRYQTSLVKNQDGSVTPAGRFKMEWYNQYYSEVSSWLPTDFRISEDGKACSAVDYINNVHPQHQSALHHALEDLLACFIPLFNKTLSNAKNLMPVRLPQLSTLDEDMVPVDPKTGRSIRYWTTLKQETRFKEWIQQAGDLYKDPVPTLNSEQANLLSRMEETYSLNGRNVQVICKIAEMCVLLLSKCPCAESLNSHLTPEKPSYAGGGWHVEGMLNESIVASGELI